MLDLNGSNNLHLIKIDPRGQPTVTAGKDPYFHTWCLYTVRDHFLKSHKKQIGREKSDSY